MEIVILISMIFAIASMIVVFIVTEKEIEEVREMRKLYEECQKLDEAVLKKIAEIKSRS